MEFVALAFAYLESAEQLTRLMNTKTWASSFHRGQAAKWLAFHACELFMKGCILHASRAAPVRGHSMQTLLRQFGKHFPTVPFDPPFRVDAIPPYPALVEEAAKRDRKFQERLKYPVDSDGKPWPGAHGFFSEVFSTTLANLRADFERIVELIKSDG